MNPKDDERREALAHLLMIGDVKERKSVWSKNYATLMLYHRRFLSVEGCSVTEKGKAFLRGEVDHEPKT